MLNKYINKNSEENNFFSVESFKLSGAPGIENYIMINEGWKRGLDVNVYKDKGWYKFSFSDGKNKVKFNRSRNENLSKLAINSCINKEMTKKYLDLCDVSYPKGKRFKNSRKDKNLILKYAEEIGFPVVLKPTFGSLGIGVFVNIKNSEELLDKIEHLDKNLKYIDIVIEDYFVGEDYRVYVVGDKVAGALKRLPANIVGDGVHNIKELIDIKNNNKRKNPYMESKIIKIDKEIKETLKEKNLTEESIIEDGEYLELRSIASISSGGDSIDVTEELPEVARKEAIKAIKALPEIEHAGVDILVSKDGKRATIIEINSRAELGIHFYPMYGKSRNIAVNILDYYFPNTKDINRDNNIIILYSDILKALRNKSIHSISLYEYPESRYKLKEIKCNINKKSKKELLKISKLAKKYNINGRIYNDDLGHDNILYIGSKVNMEKFRILLEDTVEIEILEEYYSNKSVFIGFYI